MPPGTEVRFAVNPTQVGASFAALIVSDLITTLVVVVEEHAEPLAITVTVYTPALGNETELNVGF